MLPFLGLSAMFGFGGHLPSASTSEPIACTMEAMLCPDGSYVGRSGPRCEFAPCPSATSTPQRNARHPLPTPAPIPSIRIYSMTPTQGPVGTEITVDGFGFTNDNTIHFGSGVIMHVPISSSVAIACTTSPSCIGGIHQTLIFTVPEDLNLPCFYSNPRCLMLVRQTTPGQYRVSVENANGISKAIIFTVVGAEDGTSGISISGLDAPTTLPIGTTGTWTVHVESSSVNSTLHYSVVWGDEMAMADAIMAPAPTTVQTSATFTHAYQRSGTYSPTFTVSDDAGHFATVSATVIITPLY